MRGLLAGIIFCVNKIGYVPVMKLLGLKPSHVLGNRDVITMNGTRPFEDVVDTNLPEEEVMAKIQQAEDRMHSMKTTSG